MEPRLKSHSVCRHRITWHGDVTLGPADFGYSLTIHPHMRDQFTIVADYADQFVALANSILVAVADHSGDSGPLPGRYFDTPTTPAEIKCALYHERDS